MTYFFLTAFILLIGPMLGIWPFKFRQGASGTNNPFWFWLADEDWFRERNQDRQATAAHEIFESWITWVPGFIPALIIALFVHPALGLLAWGLSAVFVRKVDSDDFDLFGHAAECYWVGDRRYTIMEAARRRVTVEELESRYWLSRLVKLLSLRIKRIPSTPVKYPLDNETINV